MSTEIGLKNYPNSSRRQFLVRSSNWTVNVFASGLLCLAPTAAWAGVENNWRFCIKCNQMFYNGHEEKGRCPGGGGHQAAGFNFALNYDPAKSFKNHQFDWRICKKCKTLFFDGYSTKGKCAFGGGHDAIGFMFGLPLRAATWGPLSQGDWRYCNKCQALFFNGYKTKGRCAAGGEHVAQGFIFFPYYLKAGVLPPPSNAPNTSTDNKLSIESELILRLHNQFRAKHCVAPLKWSPALAQAAQRWAQLCTPNPANNTGFAHETNSPYGENLHGGPTATATSAVESFYNEIQLYNFDNPVWSSKVGHFTQLVWRQTTEIGAAKAVCNGKTFYVFKYKPPGNVNVLPQGGVTAQQAAANLRANVPRPC